MPPPTQYSVYDKGIPIAVDPRPPIAIATKTTPVSTSIPSKPIPSGIPGFRHHDTRTLATSMQQQPIIAACRDRNRAKRSTLGEMQDSLPKRTKVVQPDSVIVQSPVHIPHTQPPTSATTVAPSTPADAVVHPILTTPIDITENDGQNDTEIASYTDVTPYLTPSGTADVSTNTTSLRIAKPISSPVPPIPLDAIATIQKTSTDLLMALVKKDALDREHQLMVGVGTIRTCLDIHFMPHMEVWKEDATVNKPAACIRPAPVQASPAPPIQAPPLPSSPQAPSPFAPQPASPVTTNKPVVLAADPQPPATASRQPLSITIPRPAVHIPASAVRSDSGSCLGIAPNRKMLETQLASARATMWKQARDLKSKDDELARSKEEIKRLEARLDKSTVAPAGHGQAEAVVTLKRVVSDQTAKINHQRSQITSLLSQNERLKKDLKAPQATSTEIKAKKQEVGAGNRSRHNHGHRLDPRQQRAPSSSADSGGSRDDSVIIGPEPPLKQHNLPSRSTQSSKNTLNNPRSPWERNFAGQSKSSASSSTASGNGRGMPSAPTGPRFEAQGNQKGNGRDEIPMYVSENGWADYFSKDGFGGMQADKIEFE